MSIAFSGEGDPGLEPEQVVEDFDLLDAEIDDWDEADGADPSERFGDRTEYCGTCGREMHVPMSALTDTTTCSICREGAPNP